MRDSSQERFVRDESERERIFTDLLSTCHRRWSHRYDVWIFTFLRLVVVICTTMLARDDSEETTKVFIENVFQRFLLSTEAQPPQFSRDYFERFTQLLTRADPIFQGTIEKSIVCLISPLHSENLVTFEYQLRLIRYSLRQQLASTLSLVDLTLLCHPLLTFSSILRHLALQIGLLLWQNTRSVFPSGAFFSSLVGVFSSDPNLYVRDALAQFFSLFIDSADLFRQLDTDLIYRILVLLDRDAQRKWIHQLGIYETLDDTCPAARAFVLHTAKDLDDEQPLVKYLQCVFDRSISDYVHQLFSILSSRSRSKRSIRQLTACVKALFLYMKQIEIEEIDESECFDLLDVRRTSFALRLDLVNPTGDDDDEEEFIASICCQLFTREISSIDLSSIVLDALHPFIDDQQSFVYQLDFYPSTIRTMLTSPIEDEKTYSHLLRCFQQLTVQSISDDDLVELIFSRVNEKHRSTLIYQSFFDLIRTKSFVVERMSKIVDDLLFEHKDLLFQWDKKDCALHFLKELVSDGDCPSWLNEIFVRRVIETLLHHTNEYIQASLIDLLASLVQSNLLSPVDTYLNTILVQFTDESLGDVVRCALAHAWLILLNKSREETRESYRISFGEHVNPPSFVVNTVIAQIPRLIGDAGQETERQCLRLIESVGTDRQLDDVLDFLAHDGCSEEIQRQARRLLFKEMSDDGIENKTKERFQDELAAILHWFEHPDEHMTLDCD